MAAPAFKHLLHELRLACCLSTATPMPSVTGRGSLPSRYPVTELATASIACAGEALAACLPSDSAARISVDRRLASLWFQMSFKPISFELPPVWDSIAGVYKCRDDKWIRLHTNALHHRRAALHVLQCDDVEGLCKDDVAELIRQNWDAADLEGTIVAQGGCAGEMRTPEEWWLNHPQGIAVAKEPLVAWESNPTSESARPRFKVSNMTRPLAGLRVLDLTRVLAGPTATRFLAAYGADVLRVDPPEELWTEALDYEMMLGKRSVILDARDSSDRAQLESLIREADILIHGYRSDALDKLGLGMARRRELNPRLIAVSLCAYGWTGPWAQRRGFDSITQMSTGIALGDPPSPLPVQALDYATGYLVAAAALSFLARGKTGEARTSLARVAHLLHHSATNNNSASKDDLSITTHTQDDLDSKVETTVWGDAHRLRAPLVIDVHNGKSIHQHWDLPASPIGSTKTAYFVQTK